MLLNRSELNISIYMCLLATLLCPSNAAQTVLALGIVWGMRAHSAYCSAHRQLRRRWRRPCLGTEVLDLHFKKLLDDLHAQGCLQTPHAPNTLQAAVCKQLDHLKRLLWQESFWRLTETFIVDGD